MGDQLSLTKSCCPIVVDPREIYFVAEQKKLIEKQTNTPYRHHRRKSSLITNHSPIPLFCSTPKNYTFYFATLSPKHRERENDEAHKKLSMLHHGKLQFHFDKNKSINSAVSPPAIQFIEPIYDHSRFMHKMDAITSSILLESVSYLTSINWFFYNDAVAINEVPSSPKNDSECVLIATDSTYGLIHRIDKDFNVTQPVAKICAQDTVDIVQIIRANELDSSTIYQKGYDIKWSTTKDGVLIFGSNGLRFKTSVIKYNQSQEIYAEDWTSKYNLIRYGCGAVYPGFIWIECILWSHIHEQWYILPRFMSINEPYDDKTYKNCGCNVMLRASHNFKDIEIISLKLKKTQRNNEAYVRSLYKNKELMQNNVSAKIDYDEARKYGIKSMKDLNEKQRENVQLKQKNISKSLCYSEDGVFGFVSAQFLSGTNDQIIMGVRRHETNNGDIQSSVCVFNVYGNVFVDEHILDDGKRHNGLIIL